MKKTIALLFLITLGLNLLAQNVTWKENELTWNDFQGKTSENVNVDSYLSYFIGLRTAKKKYDDIKVLKFEAYSYVEPTASWVKEKSKTPDNLKYNQVVFDILELYTRKLQHTLNKAAHYNETDNLFFKNNKEFSEILSKYQKETNFGKNKDIVDFWSEKIEEELRLMPIKEMPNLKEMNFAYGMHFGLGFGVPVSNLEKYFSPYILGEYGFDLAFKNSNLFINVALGSGKIKENYLDNQRLWKKDDVFSIALGDFSYGYTFTYKEKHKITPFVGFGLSEFSEPNNLEKDIYSDILKFVSYNPVFGINYDYRFRKVINLVPNPFFSNYKESIDATIRAKLFIKPVNYTAEIKGLTFNFSLSINGFGRRVKIID